jgi:hypothetical protein
MNEAAAAGIADYRLIRVLSAVSHGMPTLSPPERIPNDGEFVAVRVLSGASRTNYAPHVACDLQRSPVVCQLPWEHTGAKAMLSGTPRRGWPNGRAGQAKVGRSGPGR